MGMARGMLADRLARRNQAAVRVEGQMEFPPVTQSTGVRKSRITLSGFWAKIGGVLRDTASTASGGKRKAVRFVGKSGLTPNCRRQQVIPPPKAA